MDPRSFTILTKGRSEGGDESLVSLPSKGKSTKDEGVPGPIASKRIKVYAILSAGQGESFFTSLSKKESREPSNGSVELFQAKVIAIKAMKTSPLSFSGPRRSESLRKKRKGVPPGGKGVQRRLSRGGTIGGRKTAAGESVSARTKCGGLETRADKNLEDGERQDRP